MADKRLSASAFRRPGHGTQPPNKSPRRPRFSETTSRRILLKSVVADFELTEASTTWRPLEPDEQPLGLNPHRPGEFHQSVGTRNSFAALDLTDRRPVQRSEDR